MFLTVLLFAATSALLVVVWNRWYTPVAPRVAVSLWLVCAAYQAPTLFTSRVDVPGNLAFVAYPWLATGRPPVKANSGIVFTEIAPWTQVARTAIAAGEVPLWNRTSASGAPLLANQQTAIFHPFTLLGLLLPLGKAFTLTACLRLFWVAFFTFVLLTEWEIATGPAWLGALAYTFCTFHVVWLLFPLGLATMMLPVCLVGVHQFSRERTARTYALLMISLAASVLGGHPESALWVWIISVAYALNLAAVRHVTLSSTLRALCWVASTFVIAMLLTAFSWYPTLGALKLTSRFAGMQSREGNPANHGLSTEWLLPLITPNVLGTPVNGTYQPPRGAHPAVLNDYGEVASSYAGLIVLGCALVAPVVARKRRPLWFAIGLMVFACCTIAEVPGWRDLVRSIPLVGVSLHQRLRVVWDLGVCIAAALTIDEFAKNGKGRRAIQAGLLVSGVAFAVIYLVRRPAFLGHEWLSIAQAIVPLVTVVLLAVLTERATRIALPAALLVFTDLCVATFHYNPPARPSDVYPTTGAIRTLLDRPKPFRIAAAGWTFLPDTPGYYGLEDVKTTDPIQNAHYMRLLRGYLNVDPTTYDLLIRDFSQPFFDYLNVQYVYLPPGDTIPDPRFREIYRGIDGTILENTKALPRYFFVHRFNVEPDFDRAVWQSKSIRDFSDAAIVDRIPPEVSSHLNATDILNGGNVQLRRYSGNRSRLTLDSSGWNLLVTSDVSWPGWRVTWNGERLPTVTVNGAFVGSFVPPGHGTLELSYRPREYETGLYALAVGFVGFIGALFYFARARASASEAVERRRAISKSADVEEPSPRSAKPLASLPAPPAL